MDGQLVVKLAYSATLLIATLLVMQLLVRRSIIEELVRKNLITASTAEQMYKPLEALAATLAVIAAAYIFFEDMVLGAILVALSAAIAAALWPILSNVFAYYVVLLGHRVRSGDLIYVDGIRGRVVRVTPAYTALRGRGGQLILVPNRVLVEKGFEKVASTSSYLRIRVRITLPRSVDKALETIASAEAKIREALHQRRLVQRGQEATIVVQRLEPGEAIIEVDVPLPTPEPRIQLINNIVKSVAMALEGLDPRVEVAEETLL